MKIPATVITGFLGAGKTTAIRHMLENANGKRIALIINEFGDLGIDREILTSCGIEGCEDDDVVELANGCICCTVADDFLPTIEKLIDRDDPPDHIVIETSGLALPKPLVKAFNWPEIRSRVTVDGVVALVDGPAVAAGQFAHDPDAVQAAREDDDALDHDSPLEEVFEDQLHCADIIVLNKSDLLESDVLERVRTELQNATNASVKVVQSSHGNIDPAILLGISGAVEDVIESRWSHHDGEDGHDHDDFDTIVVSIGDVTDPKKLEASIQDLAKNHSILRVKGFVHVPGKSMRHVVQAVGGRVQHYFDREWQDDEPRESRLVVIGESGFDHGAVTASLQQ
jgi:cobalamin biosynthesis protein CobW